MGATMALLAASKGLSVCLLEKKHEPTRHPAAHVLNGRSLEIWEGIDSTIPERITEAAMHFDETARITWQTSLAGETLGGVSIYGDRCVLERVAAQGRWERLHLGQHKLEPILWEAVRRQPLIDFLTGTACRDLRRGDGGVTVIAETKDGEQTYEGRYLVSAEGANATLRDRLGITMVGTRLAELASVFFHARLPEDVESRLPILIWLLNQDIAGPVIRHGDGDWILMTFYLPSVQSRDEFTDHWWLPRIRAAVGKETAIEIRSRGTWTMTSEMADRFRDGRVFLVGDSAHRFPPTGGFGLNCGVADAHNLAWKLAAVLRHGADAALLDTYETERRPVIQAFADQSVRNLRQLDLVNAHLGIRNEPLLRLDEALSRFPLTMIPRRLRRRVADSLMARGLQQVARKLDPQAPGRAALLEAMDVDIQKQKEHFSATGLEYGYAYEQGFVLPEDGPKPVIGDGVATYRPTTWPGARLPYGLLCEGTAAASTHGLVSTEHFTLLTATGDEPEWSRRAHGVELAGLGIEVHGMKLDDAEQWDREFELRPGGAVLVRPDGHVAWRALDRAAASGWEAAVETLNRSIQGGNPA